MDNILDIVHRMEQDAKLVRRLLLERGDIEKVARPRSKRLLERDRQDAELAERLNKRNKR